MWLTVKANCQVRLFKLSEAVYLSNPFFWNTKPRHLVIGSGPLGTIQCFNLHGSGVFGPLHFKLGLYIGKSGTYCQLPGLIS